MSKSFNKVSALDDNTVMIVDALNLAFRYKHAKSHEFLEDYLRVVDSLKRSYKASKVIITCDEGSSSYRKEIYPEYKQNRKDKYENQTEQEKREFELFFEEFNRTMDTIDYPVLRFPRVEADDIAAYLVSNIPSHYNVWLISSDKDWDLLVDHRTSRFSYVTRKETRLDNWNEHYDYEPEEHISIKCLNGDSGDNIKGVEGIGPKRAHDLIKQYGTIFDIIAAIPIQSKYKYIQALNESADILMRNAHLMDLVTYSEDAIGVENVEKIKEVIKGL